MKNYIRSALFEMNQVNDKSIFFSQDCKNIYEADLLETFIISKFEAPCSLNEIKEICMQIEGYNESDLLLFINDLISKKIIVEIEAVDPQC